MRVLFDTNIVLDVLLNREPFVTEAKALWEANDDGRLTGYISASSLTDIFYVARRIAGVEAAGTAVRVCLDAFEICEIDRPVLEYAYSLAGTDFEDDLQIACAHFADIGAIVTRDKTGFSGSPVLAATPGEVLSKL
jgi:predicted nucleic acid-binding protein